MTQQPVPPGLGTVRLHLQGSTLTRTITPSVSVNGYFVPVRFGSNDIPVHPGRTLLHVHTQWMRVFGQADLPLDVAPGSVTEVWYAAPWHQFTTGSIGFEKQSSKGKGVLAAVLGFALLVVLLVVVAGVLTS